MSILLFSCGSLRFRWNSPGQASLNSLRRSNSKFSWNFSPEKAKMKKDTRHSPALPQAKQHLDPRECVPLASSNSCWKEPIFSFPNRQSRDKTKNKNLLLAEPHPTQRAHTGRGCPESSAKCHCQGSFSTTQTSFPAFYVGVFGPSQASSQFLDPNRSCGTLLGALLAKTKILSVHSGNTTPHLHGEIHLSPSRGKSSLLCCY